MMRRAVNRNSVCHPQTNKKAKKNKDLLLGYTTQQSLMVSKRTSAKATEIVIIIRLSAKHPNIQASGYTPVVKTLNNSVLKKQNKLDQHKWQSWFKQVCASKTS